VLLVLWTGEWGQGNGRIFGSSVRDESLCLVLPTGVGTYVPLISSLRYPRALNLVYEAMACSTIPGRRPEQPVHSLSARNAIYGHSPVPIPLSTNEHAGVREMRSHLRTLLFAAPVENVWKKASPLKVGRSPRGFCLQVFANFCASRSLDRGMGTREWSNLRFIRSRCIPLPCASNRRRHLRALDLIFAIPTCSKFGR